MKITFCGAAKVVSGSCYLIEVGETKLLVDCGMFQGPKGIGRLNYEPFRFDPKEIDFVFLTHAHIDHSGLIPKLYKNGFKGKIYATSATKDLVGILLEDSAAIQDANVKEENKRRARAGLKLRKPMYVLEDVERSMLLFTDPVIYDTLVNVNENIQIRYQDAGHIIGSSIIELFVTEGEKKTKIVFSGDIGQRDVPIVRDPTLISEADYLFMESTYGDRLHEGVDSKEELLLRYVNEAYEKGGKLLIPSFAVERTQELLYLFNKLIRQKKFPQEKIFLDSPLAAKATEIFKKHKECFDEEALEEYSDPFNPAYLKYSVSVQDSQKLNDYQEPCVIIAGSGMCNAGRITHHLKHGLWDKRNTLLFVGYQAEGTLGRHILEGEKKVKLLGIETVVNLDIRKINSFSGHADKNQLIRWAKGFTTLPKKVFVIHGEGNAQLSLAESLKELGMDTYIPSLGEEIEI